MSLRAVAGELRRPPALTGNPALRTVPTNSKVFLPRFMMMQEI